MTATTTRPLWAIAEEISQEAQAYRDANDKWPTWFAYSQPYVDAMLGLTSIDQHYGYDTAHSVVLYCLSNLQSWRGETARRVKAELKSIAGLK